MENSIDIPSNPGRPRQLTPEQEAGLTTTWILKPRDRRQTAKDYGLSRRGGLTIVRRFLRENPSFLKANPSLHKLCEEAGLLKRRGPGGATRGVSSATEEDGSTDKRADSTSPSPL